MPRAVVRVAAHVAAKKRVKSTNHAIAIAREACLNLSRRKVALKRRVRGKTPANQVVSSVRVKKTKEKKDTKAIRRAVSANAAC